MTNVNWSSYAEVYDLMSESNPAYQDVVKLVERRASQWILTPDATVAELGAGTGNISLMLARRFRSQRVLHVDSDDVMSTRAQYKADEQGLSNIRYLKQDADTAFFQPESLNAVVLVHALYTFQNPNALIKRCHTWLKPGGILFVCDIGKVLNVTDWASYLFFSMTRNYGLVECLRRFYMGRAIASQNRRISRAQRDGVYWTHTLQELRACVSDAGFVISANGVCYRGYSDWLEAIREE
jgi:ubiquinone/menaquinone biosynthesis C-methylase UbiE